MWATNFSSLIETEKTNNNFLLLQPIRRLPDELGMFVSTTKSICVVLKMLNTTQPYHSRRKYFKETTTNEHKISDTTDSSITESFWI